MVLIYTHMKQILLFSLLCIASTSLTSCQTNLQAMGVRGDADSLRYEVQQYYNKELITNLAKTGDGGFFVHVDINQLNSEVQYSMATSVQGGQTENNSSSLQATSSTTKTGSLASLGTATIAGTAGVVTNVAAAVARPFTFSVSPSTSNTINMNAVPAIGDPTVYDAYVHYINLIPGEDWYKDSKHIQPVRRKTRFIWPDSVRAASTSGDHIIYSIARSEYRPKSVEGLEPWVHGTLLHLIVHPSEGKSYWYWIPIEFQQQYFAFCMALTGTRSGSATPPPPALVLTPHK